VSIEWRAVGNTFRMYIGLGTLLIVILILILLF
jgi:hypothetical protein